jgi:glutaminyl-peptide cyclotransferase
MWKISPFLLLPLLISCSRPGADERTQSLSTMTSTQQQPLVIPAFSGERAFAYLLNQTAFGPRNPNSPGHEACKNYFITTLRTTAEDVRLQEFTVDGYDGEKLRLTNVIASFRPNDPDRVLLCAHWDTRPRAERDEDPKKRNLPILGANDAASGVAVLLELASLLKTTPPRIGVDLVLLDGEDYGKEADHERYLLGSRHFARTKPADYLPRFGVLLDMVGDAQLEIPREMHSFRYAPDIVSLVWGTARELGYTQFIDENGDEILDDHVPLNEAGIKTIDIIDFNYPDQTHRYWHTHQDTPEHCSAQSLEAVGTVLTHVVYKQKK